MCVPPAATVQQSRPTAVLCLLCRTQGSVGPGLEGALALHAAQSRQSRPLCAVCLEPRSTARAQHWAWAPTRQSLPLPSSSMPSSCVDPPDACTEDSPFPIGIGQPHIVSFTASRNSRSVHQTRSSSNTSSSSSSSSRTAAAAAKMADEHQELDLSHVSSVTRRTLGGPQGMVEHWHSSRAAVILPAAVFVHPRARTHTACFKLHSQGSAV